MLLASLSRPSRGFRLAFEMQTALCRGGCSWAPVRLNHNQFRTSEEDNSSRWERLDARLTGANEANPPITSNGERSRREERRSNYVGVER